MNRTQRKGVLLVVIALVLMLVLIGSISSVEVALHSAAFFGIMACSGWGLYLLFSQVGK